jgi:L-ascorbate metabolism protein UlaG (beta-lactamase superfamily)
VSRTSFGGGWLLRGLALVATCSTVGCFGAPSYHWPASKPVPPHWDGDEFHNVPEQSKAGLFKALRWRATREPIEWAEGRNDAVFDRPPASVPAGKVRVVVVNHATTLIQVDGVNILTDPVWSDVIGPLPGIGVGVHRQLPPGIRFDDLPPIHAVLLSHSHYDHCDVPTLERLAARFHMPIYAGLGTTALLNEAGIANGHDLDWWQTIELRVGEHTVALTFAPAEHWSRRGAFDQNQLLWGSFGIRTPSALVYFAGDSAAGPHFQAFHDRVGPPDVALVPIGAYKPNWFMLGKHMGPNQAVQAFQDLGAAQAIAIHWGTFNLADEGQFEPAGELGLALDHAGIARSKFVAPRNGEAVWVEPGVLPPAREVAR